MSKSSDRSIAAVVLVAIAALAFAAGSAFADAAQDCLNTQDPERQIGACTEYLRQTQITAQQRSRAHDLRGTAYLRQLQFDRAVLDFDEAIRLNPNNTLAYAQRGKAQEIMGMSLGGQTALDKAATDYGRAGELADAARRTNPSAQLDEAVASLRDHRDCDQAKDAARRVKGCSNVIDALRSRATAVDALAYENRALAYEELRDYGRALADFDRAIALNPNYVLALVDRAGLHRFQGQNGAAQRDFAEAAQQVDRMAARSADPELAKFAKELRDRAIGSSDEEQLEQRWIAYLKELEAANDYQNWSDRPYTLYRARQGGIADQRRK